MYDQRDVLIIPVPFTDLTSEKKRPVLVLSNDAYNACSEDIVVAAITSNLTEKEYAVLLDDGGMENGVLPKVSMIRADKIYTLSQNIVVKKYGKVNVEIFDAVREKMEELTA